MVIVDRTPLVYAHRGASSSFPENTVEAFGAALDQGADGVELDVRRSRDGRLVVVHDPRYPDGRAVHEVDLVDAPQGVPELQTALEVCAGALVNVEIKNSSREPAFDEARSLADDVVAAVRRLGIAPRVVVSSFDQGAVDRVRELEPDLATGWLVAAGVHSRLVDRCVQSGHRYLHPWDRIVTANLVRRAHAAGVGLNVWTVDDPDRIARLARWGVDAVITNDPTTALDALDPAR